MPFGTEVGLGPGNIVLFEDPAPPTQKWGNSSTQFSAYVYRGQTAGWIKVPLGTEIGLGPGNTVLDGDPAHPPTERGRAVATFRPMSVVAKRSLILATAD